MAEDRSKTPADTSKPSKFRADLNRLLQAESVGRRALNETIFWVALASCVAAIVVLAISTGAAVVYAVRFAPQGWSADPKDWQDTAGFLGFVSQGVLGVATLFSALLISLIVAGNLERQKKDEQRRRELIRLSEKMVDPEFYVKVMYPTWEIALKWTELETGDRFHAQVVGGEVRLPKPYTGAEDPEDVFVENIPRRHPYFLAYDLPDAKGAKVIGELSESLAFATWVRFWRHVVFLVVEKELDPDKVRALFLEWYMWWAPFMLEFVAVSQKVMVKAAEVFGDGGLSAKDDQTSIAALDRLHRVIFDIPKFSGHPDQAAFDARVDAIFAVVWPLLEASTEAARNKANFPPRL